jgi:HK97 gp10 family phage protein
MYVKVELKGAAEVVAALHGLARGLRNRILRKALRAGANVIRDLARSKVPKGPARAGKHLKPSIKVVQQTYKKSGAVVAYVTSKAPQAHLVELGHAASRAGLKLGTTLDQRRRKLQVATGKRALTIRLPGGQVVMRASTQAVRRHPFLQPAVDEGAGKCLAEIARVIDQELTALSAKEAARLAA